MEENTSKITPKKDDIIASKVDDSFMEDIYKDDYVDLYKLEGLDVKDQSKVFSSLLTHLYEKYNDIDYGEIRKLSLKCLKLSCDPEETVLRLAHKLIVSKDGNRLYFEFEDETKKNRITFIIVLICFIVATIAATFFGLRFLSVAHLNIDIDGDGIADLNLDLNNDEKEEVNVSKDGKKPNYNVDYRGNRKKTFNIDSDNDGKADKNLINQDSNKDGICDINCDYDKDGWPEINIDLDGDGKVDMFVDTDGDKKANLNFDTNNDGVCDLHCDTNDDGVCDKYCVSNLEIIENFNGKSSVVGSDGNDFSTAEFIVNFIDSKEIKVNDLFPEDQTGDFTKSVTKNFEIQNNTTAYVRYKIAMKVSNNSFTSNNFVYSLVSDEAEINSGFITVPKVTSIIQNNILIPPKTTHKYTLTFKLVGINKSQNFDQGKKFAGQLKICISDDETCLDDLR